MAYSCSYKVYFSLNNNKDFKPLKKILVALQEAPSTIKTEQSLKSTKKLIISVEVSAEFTEKETELQRLVKPAVEEKARGILLGFLYKKLQNSYEPHYSESDIKGLISVNLSLNGFKYMDHELFNDPYDK